MTCTFFGHRDCPDNIKDMLKSTITDLIEKHSVADFFVGNNGNFDHLALSVLHDISHQYPFIRYTVVLAYLPTKFQTEFGCPTLYTQGIENAPKRFAITFRNKWMIEHSDYIISYVTHSFGGAYQWLKFSQSHGKTCINISE